MFPEYNTHKMFETHSDSCSKMVRAANQDSSMNLPFCPLLLMPVELLIGGHCIQSLVYYSALAVGNCYYCHSDRVIVSYESSGR